MKIICSTLEMFLRQKNVRNMHIYVTTTTTSYLFSVSKSYDINNNIGKHEKYFNFCINDNKTLL